MLYLLTDTLIVVLVLSIIFSFFFLMAQLNHDLQPRKQVDYVLLHSGKELQFPTYGFSLARPTPEHEQSTASPSLHSAGFTELQQLLAQDKEETRLLSRQSNWKRCSRNWKPFACETLNSREKVPCPPIAVVPNRSNISQPFGIFIRARLLLLKWRQC